MPERWLPAAELVADRVEPLVANEFRGLPEHERLAAIEAVRSTFDAPVLTESDLSNEPVRDAWVFTVGFTRSSSTFAKTGRVVGRVRIAVARVDAARYRR